MHTASGGLAGASFGSLLGASFTGHGQGVMPRYVSGRERNSELNNPLTQQLQQQVRAGMAAASKKRCAPHETHATGEPKKKKKKMMKKKKEKEKVPEAVCIQNDATLGAAALARAEADGRCAKLCLDTDSSSPALARRAALDGAGAARRPPARALVHELVDRVLAEGARSSAAEATMVHDLMWFAFAAASTTAQA